MTAHGSTRRHDRQAGFTLVEMMVAMFIFSLLAAAGSGIVFQTLQGKARLEAETARLSDFAALRAALKDDLGQATLRPARGPGGAIPFSGGASDADPALLSLTRRGWTNPAGLERRSSLLAVSYRVEDGALVRTAWLRPDAAPDTPARDQVMMRGVQSAEIRFMAQGQWSAAWRADGDGLGLPQVVELVLDIDGVGPVRQLFLTSQGGA